VSLTHEVEESGDVIVYDQAGQQLLALNAIGAAVWYLIDGRRSEAEIVDMLVESVQADRARVSADVASFLDDLVARGVVSFEAS
jgi:hypothetical protein